MKATALALALCLSMSAGCADDVSPENRCGPRPATMETMLVRQSVRDGIPTVTIDTNAWHRHEAWVGDVLAWTACMTE